MVLRKLKYSCYVALAMLGVACSANAAAFSAEENNKPNPKLCVDYADPIRVRVNGTEFHIPDKYKPDLNNGTHGDDHQPKKSCTCRNVKNPETGLYDVQYGYCQKKDDPPLEVSSIFLRQVFPSYQEVVTTALLKKLDISVRGQLTIPPQYFFCAKKQRIDANANIKPWREYPEAPGFYEAEYKSYETKYGSVYYDSDKHRLWGMPVVINCARRETVITESWGRKCHLQTSLGSKNSLVVRFYDRYLPPSEWETAFKDIENFLRTVMPTPPKIPEFTSCNSSTSKE